MNLILIASPAAGKGTFASMLCEKYDLISISAGELLRGVDPNSELGKQIAGLLSSRGLVDDSITNQLMKERLMKDDIKKGFILDGYPRRIAQVYATENICEELNLHVDYAVLLNVSFENALKRTLGRKICPKCKKTYNSLTGVNIPENENMCDECNVELITRSDDNEETLRIGFDSYKNNALEVIEYYRKKGMLIELDSNGDINDTFDEFLNKIGNLND